MTTATTYTQIPAARGGGRSWLRRFFDRMVEAQLAAAQRQVDETLRGMDERTLRSIGFSDRDIATLRRGGHVEFPN